MNRISETMELLEDVYHAGRAAISGARVGFALVLKLRRTIRSQRLPTAEGEVLRRIATSVCGVQPLAGETDEQLRKRCTDKLRGVGEPYESLDGLSKRARLTRGMVPLLDGETPEQYGLKPGKLLDGTTALDEQQRPIYVNTFGVPYPHGTRPETDAELRARITAKVKEATTSA